MVSIENYGANIARKEEKNKIYGQENEKKYTFFGCAIVFRVFKHIKKFGGTEKTPYLCSTLKDITIAQYLK